MASDEDFVAQKRVKWGVIQGKNEREVGTGIHGKIGHWNIQRWSFLYLF
jgi:dihydroxyacetone kinase